MPKKVNYFEAQRPYAPTTDRTLSEVYVRIVPTLISAIETRKARSFWETDEDWEAAYNDLSAQQWELMNDMTDRIVSEIRALRDGPNTPLLDQDPELNPYGLSLTSIADIYDTQQAITGETTAQLLVELRTAIAQVAAQQQAQSIEIARIAAIVAGLI